MICQLATCDVFHNLKPIASRKSKKKKKKRQGRSAISTFCNEANTPESQNI